jgi:hypothetical protein
VGTFYLSGGVRAAFRLLFHAEVLERRHMADLLPLLPSTQPSATPTTAPAPPPPPSHPRRNLDAASLRSNVAVCALPAPQQLLSTAGDEHTVATVERLLSYHFHNPDLLRLASAVPPPLLQSSFPLSLSVVVDVLLL